ncbi:MAG: amino acid dehydrogenase, partial [Deltaproteobacteria bacterium]|nr:amino acid dehydrogenase [Deltaproteobacteria bacterium]
MRPGRYIWIDPSSGLEAVLFVDSLALGPAVGGVRTTSYATLNDAIADAARLAHSMTIKSALAGLDAGGCKIVVRSSANMNRELAFERLGKFLAELGDHIHTGADLGTSED